MKDILVVDEVCKAAGCPASTLRSWRNRNGLFPHHGSSGGWTRYSLADAVGVKMMVLFSKRGHGAQESVNAVNQMREAIEMSVQGGRLVIAFGMNIDGDAIEWRKVSEGKTVRDEIMVLDDPMKIVLDISHLTFQVMFSIREQRGLTDILPDNDTENNNA